MIRAIIVALAILAAGARPAAAGGGTPVVDWADGDKAILATAMLLHVADWSQTLRLVDTPGLHERNPILGRRPSRGEINAYFVGTAALMVVIAHALPEWRTPMLYGYIAVGAMAVGNNIALGVRIGF